MTDHWAAVFAQVSGLPLQTAKGLSRSPNFTLRSLRALIVQIAAFNIAMKELLKNNQEHAWDIIRVPIVEMLKHALYSRRFRLQEIEKDSFKTLLKVLFLNVVLRKRPTFELSRTLIYLISSFVLCMQHF